MAPGPNSLATDIIFLIFGVICALAVLQGSYFLVGSSTAELVSVESASPSLSLKRSTLGPDASTCQCKKFGDDSNEYPVEFRDVVLPKGNLTLRLPRNTAILRNVSYEEIHKLCKEHGKNGEIINGVRCCPEASAERFFQKYPAKRPNRTREAFFMDVIRNASNALHEAGIPFFIMGGTLLGWRRECGVIAHTTDIDFGIFEEDWDTQKLHAALTTIANMNFSSCTSFHGHGWEVSYRTKQKYRIWANKRLEDSIKIDVRQLTREKMYTWMGAGQTRSNRHQRWMGHPYIIPADFRGIPVGVLNDVDMYLSLEYNKFWVVQEKFQWDLGQSNLVHYIPRWNSSLPGLRNTPVCSIDNGGYSLAPLPPLKPPRRPPTKSLFSTVKLPPAKKKVE